MEKEIHAAKFAKRLIPSGVPETTHAGRGAQNEFVPRMEFGPGIKYQNDICDLYQSESRDQISK
jgi:hypothetical protein